MIGMYIEGNAVNGHKNAVIFSLKTSYKQKPQHNDRASPHRFFFSLEE